MTRATCFVIALLAALGCEQKGAPARIDPSAARAQQPAPQAVAAGTSLPAHESPAAGKVDTGSPVYDLKMSLIDQDGRPFGLDAFAGHPTVISMFYATCPFACPTLISDIKRFERSLTPTARAELRVLLVSFDPERDTPEKLKALAQDHGLDTKRYKLARASADEVRVLAAVLGIKYRKLESGAINHSSAITLLDRSGRVAGRVDGLNQPLDLLKTALQNLQDP